MSDDAADAQVTFRLSSRIAAKLDRIAANRGVQRSVLLREAAERLVAGEESRFRLVEDLIGSVRSGVSDLGTEHRRHLRRAFSRGR